MELSELEASLVYIVPGQAGLHLTYFVLVGARTCWGQRLLSVSSTAPQLLLLPPPLLTGFLIMARMAGR